MGVLRTGCSAIGAIDPERAPAGSAGPTDVVNARAIAVRLLACLPSILLYWHHFATTGKRIDVETDEPTHAGHFLRLLHQRTPSVMHARALDRSLILYAGFAYRAKGAWCPTPVAHDHKGHEKRRQHDAAIERNLRCVRVLNHAEDQTRQAPARRQQQR
jgi:hypothetical protein